MLATTNVDPARLSWARCREIHPTQLPCLCAAIIDVLADIAGIERDRLVFEPLRCIRTVGDLARFPWAILCAQLHALARGPCPHIEEGAAHLRLFAELAVVHHRLYLARSGSTLKLLHRCCLPFDLPPELSSIRDDFGQQLGKADRALLVGRATLAHFQRQVAATRHPLPALLCAVIDRARVCYQHYQRAIKAARDITGYAAWYLSWVEEDRQPARRAQPIVLSAPTQATPLPRRARPYTRKHGSAVQVPGRWESGAAPGPYLSHTRKRGGFTTIMSNSPTDELSAFCSTCPAAKDVTDTLAPFGFTLAFFMEEQVFPAYSATPPIPPQYHYLHHTDGTEVIYLAGKDAGDEEERLPPHASRFWIYPGSSPHVMHLVAQMCAAKWHLSWKPPRSEAIA